MNLIYLTEARFNSLPFYLNNYHMSIIPTNFTGSYTDYHMFREMLWTCKYNVLLNVYSVEITKQIVQYVQLHTQFHVLWCSLFYSKQHIAHNGGMVYSIFF